MEIAERINQFQKGLILMGMNLFIRMRKTQRKIAMQLWMGVGRFSEMA